MDDRQLKLKGYNVVFRKDRFPSVLDPSSVKIDDRSFFDLVEESIRYAQRVNFYNDNDERYGLWAKAFDDFMKPADDLLSDGRKILDRQKLSERMSSGEMPPQLALLLSFLKLFAVEQEQMNLMTKRHLDYFYRELLGMSPKKGKVGNVPVSLKIANGYERTLVPAGTRFDAGKDSAGKQITYRSKYDYFLTRATLDMCRRMTVDWDLSKGSVIRCSCFDGINVEDEYRSSKPFGFAVASPLFNIGFGKMTVYIDGCSKIWNVLESIDNLWYTSPDGWTQIPCKFVVQKSMEPAPVEEEPVDSEPVSPVSVYPVSDKAEDNIVGFENLDAEACSLISGSQVIAEPKMIEKIEGYCFEIDVPKDVPVSCYDESIHKGSFVTEHPVFCFAAPECNLTLSDARTSDFKIKQVCVTDSLSFELVGQFGNVRNEKNSLLFQDSPIRGSRLFICADAFRYLFDAHIKLPLHNPESRYLENIESLPDTVFLECLRDSEIHDTLSLFIGICDTDNNRLIVELDNDFGNSTYGQRLIDAISNKETIPAKAYAPCLGREMTVDYTLTPGTKDESQYYAFNPFGMNKCPDEGFLSFPDFHGSEFHPDTLYLGFGNAQDDSVVSLYMNPTRDYLKGSTETQTVIEYLEGTKWMSKDISIIRDTTCGLTKPGIISFNLPGAASVSHSVLPGEARWVRITDAKHSCLPTILDCQIHTIELEYDPDSSGIGILGERLPAGTVTKLVGRLPGVKNISQDYQGFLGEMPETDVEFYTRASERLRHKNRAWTKWDYERLVLEHFPEVAAVSCMSSEIGYEGLPVMTVRVVPDLSMVDAIDPLRPSFPQYMLNEIATYLAQRTSPFVSVQVISPKYDPITLDVAVVLKKEYLGDKNYYRKMIDEALVSYLTPWSKDNNDFGYGTRYDLSRIVLFLEELPYVECVEKLTACQSLNSVAISEGYITPVEPDMFLTSAPEHKISIK